MSKSSRYLGVLGITSGDMVAAKRLERLASSPEDPWLVVGRARDERRSEHLKKMVRSMVWSGLFWEKEIRTT